jgi:hypothetical protein
MTAPFKAGDLVTCDYQRRDEMVARRVTKIRADAVCLSGYRVWLDAGERCPACGGPHGESIDGIDSGYCRRVNR